MENPKDKYGKTKPSISKVPPSAIVYAAIAMQNGAEKYGQYNWRDKDVIASIYIDACMRHLMQWMDGEEIAEDSGVPHLGHAIACLAILVDSLENNNLIDDRPNKGPVSSVIIDYTKELKDE